MVDHLIQVLGLELQAEMQSQTVVWGLQFLCHDKTIRDILGEILLLDIDQTQ